MREIGWKSVFPGKRNTEAFESLPGLLVIPHQERLQQEVFWGFVNDIWRAMSSRANLAVGCVKADKRA